jgi:hypothetical protein
LAEAGSAAFVHLSMIGERARTRPMPSRIRSG